MPECSVLYGGKVPKKQSPDIELFKKAVESACRAFHILPGQVESIELIADEYSLDYGDEEGVLGFFDPARRLIRIACSWDSEADGDKHLSPFDVCRTIFHEFAHSLQEEVGALEMYGCPHEPETQTLERGADKFAHSALACFLNTEWVTIRKLVSQCPSRRRGPKSSRKKGK
jgi:hypothetical protein